MLFHHFLINFLIKIIKKVEKEHDLHGKALSLCQYLIANNEFRSVVDPNEIESWIEEDFISLDDYIHKI